jgi:hypothetical protein
MAMMQDFEKLGVFYLGCEYDVQAKKRTDKLLLYDSKDLTTHAVCVGMTGSGKTGLCIDILEEAAIDGIPAIVIDPKGDLSNLLLTFPQLRPEDFRPWINEDDAAKKSLTPDAYAQQQAQFWTDGLASWGQSAARIQKLRDAADFLVYTPGSSAGRPISILKSLSAPEKAIVEDNDLLQERIRTTVTSLLGLIGIDADPIQSREHILLSTLFNNAWKDGRELSLEKLITGIQQPPFGRVGVLDIDTFFPPRERSGLALKLNNLLAAPGFAMWLQGDALDINSILYTQANKPKISIFSIAHLSDAERMFFVSLLLNQVIGWMRGQSGTTSLRAVVYMDEIFGYFPPVANPPSKEPMLTLMKQARAYGVGMVLATQNPVDIDYKGLSNAGTWFIGRLQTEQDKNRVLDGLAGASQEAGVGFDQQKMSKLLSALNNRVFLMNNVHEDGPVVFESRWAMSYLRGPLTRSQLKQLTQTAESAADSSQKAPAISTAMPGEPADKAVAAVDGNGEKQSASAPPVLSPDISQEFIAVRCAPPAGASLLYRPALLGFATVYYQDTKSALDTTKSYTFSAAKGADDQIDWDNAKPVDMSRDELEKEGQSGAAFAAVPDYAANPRNYALWTKQLADAIYRTQRLELFHSDHYGQYSNAGENERDFRLRLAQTGREERDAAVAKLRQKYAPKQAAMQERLRRAQAAVDREKSQAQTSGLQTVISLGATLLGAFLGKKKISASTVGRATTAARGAGRTAKDYSDVGRAEESVQAVQAQQAELDTQFQKELGDMESTFDPATEPLETTPIRPKKANVKVDSITLTWTPYWRLADGMTSPAWT